jgi:hypothetical protein
LLQSAFRAEAHDKAAVYASAIAPQQTAQDAELLGCFFGTYSRQALEGAGNSATVKARTALPADVYFCQAANTLALRRAK